MYNLRLEESGFGAEVRSHGGEKKDEGTGRRVGVWLRVSTEDQAKGESPEHHEHRARHYAESKDWRIIEVYHLEAVSGKTVMEHPEAKRMLKDVERGHISSLIFSKLARLARNTRELLEFSEIFQRLGADLISLQESIDTSTPVGRFFYTVMAALAHWEQEEIGSRVAASIPVRAKLGKPLGGPAPLGYQWKDKKLVPDPKEVSVRRLVHELYLKHRRMKTVATLLNEAGHRTRKGKPFHANAIEFLLRDSTPKGIHRANYVTVDPKTRRWIPKPEADWVYNEVEPIMDAALWDACAALIKEKDDGRTPRAKQPVQLFAGLLFCHCGQKMYAPSNTPKYVCKECRNKIAIGDLEDLFIEQIQTYMLSRTELTGYMAAKNQDLQAKQELLDALSGEERTLKSEMEKVYRLYMTDQITPEGFGSLYKPMELRLKQLSQELPKIAPAIDFLKVNLLSDDQILDEAKNLAAFWPSMTRDAKRRVVESMVKRITLGIDEIDMNLFYLPSLTATDPDDDPEDDSDDPTDSESFNDDSDNGTAPPITSTTVKASAFSENMAKRRIAMSPSGFSNRSPCE